jgi:hypothetical protein
MLLRRTTVERRAADTIGSFDVVALSADGFERGNALAGQISDLVKELL